MESGTFAGRVTGLALVALVTLGGSQNAVAGQCQEPRLTPHIVTPQGASVPDDGGVLVAHQDSQSSLGGGFLDPRAKLRFFAGKTSKPAVPRTVAPGLVVLEGPGTSLVDGMNPRKRTLLTFGRPAVPPPALATPKVKSVTFHRGQSRRPRTSVVVKLGATTTARQILVVLDAEGTGARSWGIAAVGADTVEVYAVGECTGVPDGTRPTAAGDDIRLAWVDLTGRLSAPTSVIRVVAAPEVLDHAPTP